MCKCLEKTMLKFKLKKTLHFTFYSGANQTSKSTKRNLLILWFFFLSFLSVLWNKKLWNVKCLLTHKRLKSTVLKCRFLTSYSLAVTFTSICEAVKLTEIKCQPQILSTRLRANSYHSVLLSISLPLYPIPEVRRTRFSPSFFQYVQPYTGDIIP